MIAIVNSNDVINISFDENIANKKCYVSENFEDGEKKISIGILSGRKGIDKQYNSEVLESYYNGVFVWLANVGSQIYVTKNLTIQMQSESQDYLNDLIKNNNIIANDILVASLFIQQLESKGFDVSSYKTELKGLYSRLIHRNKQIQDSGYVANIVNSDVKQIDKTLTSAISGCNIGFVLTTGTVIIITASVVAVMASMAWYIFYNLDMESRTDIRKSKELNKLLENVDPETKEEIYQFVNNFGDERYKDGIRRMKNEALWTNFKKYGLIAGGVFLLFYAKDNGFLNRKGGKNE